jgi:Protein of unknown function (DUF3551)
MTTIRAACALLAFCSLTAIDARPSAAEVYRPWCVQYQGARSGATSCAFTSFEQCMLTARGAGAYCVQNPWYLQYGDRSRAPETTGRSGRTGRW